MYVSKARKLYPWCDAPEAIAQLVWSMLKGTQGSSRPTNIGGKTQNWFALAATTHIIHTPAGQKIATHAVLYNRSCTRTLECPCSNPPSRAPRDVPLVDITSRLASSQAMLIYTCFPPFVDFSHHIVCPLSALFLFCPGPLPTLRRPALATCPRRLAF